MMEFSKILLIVDYAVMLLLIILIIVTGSDLAGVAVAWIAQIGVSSASYYSKAKTENKTKVPLLVVKNLPKNIRDQLDLTAIIQTIISGE